MDESDKLQRDRQVRPLPVAPPSPHYHPEDDDPSTLVEDKDSYQPMRKVRVTDATDTVMDAGWGCSETYKTKNQGK
jgi:hypothetical protein